MNSSERQLRIAELVEKRSKARDEVDEIEKRIRATTGVLKGLITSLDDLYNGPNQVVLDLQLHAISVTETGVTYDNHEASTDAFERLLAHVGRLQGLRKQIICLETNLKTLGINH